MDLNEALRLRRMANDLANLILQSYLPDSVKEAARRELSQFPETVKVMVKCLECGVLCGTEFLVLDPSSHEKVSLPKGLCDPCRKKIRKP